MAALLVAMSIMAVMMTVVMPVWKQTAQREKEEELVFRGLQYAHAIGMFQRKYANAYPPNFDVLVEQRFLRKKFKDPITNDDFAPIAVGQSLPGSGARGNTQTGSSAASGRSNLPGASNTTPVAPSTSTASRGGLGGSPPGGTGIQTTAGISGVTSKSKDTSIRIYNGRSHYNEWAFVYTPQIQAAGQGGAAGTQAPGQRGQQPGAPGTGNGQRGQPGTDPFGRGRGGQGTNPFGPGSSPFGNPGGRGPGGTQPAQPIFGPQPTPRGRE